MAKKESFDLKENKYYQKSLFDIESVDCEKEFWNVDETISELSYLTHDYFRYYGKFPSKIGKMIIEDLLAKGVIDSKSDFIIDNYSGSGTSLVEAKLAGIDSIGFDINPFAVLAGRVKTYNYEMEGLYKYWDELREEISSYNNHYLGGLFAQLTDGLDENKLHLINKVTQQLCNDDAFSKWFPDDTIRQLYIIKMCLLKRELTREREFLIWHILQ